MVKCFHYRNSDGLYSLKSILQKRFMLIFN